MRIEFIAQGLNDQSTTVGKYLCSSFRDENYNSFFCFSAFTKVSGLKYLIDDIESVKDKYKSIRFYLGISEKGTSKEALELLLDKSIETWTFCTSSAIIFHPKIYLFEGEFITRIIVGSSNLTKPGLFDNIEASIVVEFSNSDARGIKFKSEILSYFDSVLKGNDPNVELLTSDSIKDFIDAGFVVEESQTKDDCDYAKRNKELFAKRKKIKIRLEELGNIETKKIGSTSERTSDFKITKQYLDSWAELFEEFVKFKQEYNSVTVPRDFHNYRLYTWYRKQKVFYSNNSIPEDHLNKLIGVGFHFGDAHELLWAKAWEDKYNELLIFFNNNGYSAIKRIRDKSNPLKKLSDWVAFQRVYYRKGELSDYEIEKLNEVNFIWELPNLGSQIDDESWFQNYLELENYKQKNGNCHPPQVNPDGSLNSLGRWVNDQMTLRNVGRANKRTGVKKYLNKTREAYLFELGVDWDYQLNKHKASFNEQIKDFLILRERYPDLKTPKGEFKKEKDWLSQMKHKFDELPLWKQEKLVQLKIINK
jgi:HKD family nuclease